VSAPATASARLTSPFVFPLAAAADGSGREAPSGSSSAAAAAAATPLSTCLLLLRPVPPALAAHDRIFTLCSAFGTVTTTRVSRRIGGDPGFGPNGGGGDAPGLGPNHGRSVLGPTRASADWMVTFASAEEAARAAKLLDGVAAFGPDASARMRATLTHAAAAAAAGRFLEAREYAAALGRFAKGRSRNDRNVAEPAAELHVSNLPPGASREALLAFFAAAPPPLSAAAAAEEEEEENEGTEPFPTLGPVSCRLFGPEKRMAFVRFPSVSQAVLALVRFHNARMPDAAAEFRAEAARAEAAPAAADTASAFASAPAGAAAAAGCALRISFSHATAEARAAPGPKY